MHRFFPGRRDPYWGLDGAAAQSGRRRRRVVAAAVLMLSAAILILILARLPSVNAPSLISGPNRLLVVASLTGDAIACCLVFARDSARRRALQLYGERSVLDD